MKKILALLITVALLLGITAAGADENEKFESLKVGNTTAFSGNFLTEALGNNSSDLDVRRLIQGYSLVFWDSAIGSYRFNERLVRAASTNDDGTSFLFALSKDLTYNDGTPITARDYAFSLLLLGSREMEAVTGGRESLAGVLGGNEYQSGITNVLSGVRILGDYQFSIQINPDFLPYFYELKALQVSPLPVYVIAPDCEVKDDGNGVYLSGPFSADLLRKTLMDPETGYISHPSVTCGPYMLTGYDGTTVELEANPAYAGDHEGIVPEIKKIEYRITGADTIMDELADGELDLVIRRARQDQIMAGMGLTGGGDFTMKAYSRSGLSFISFCAEKGPTASENVRKAISLCIDEEGLTAQYTGSFGTTVNGYYGIGQWMFMMANGTLVPEEGAEDEWADLNLEGIVTYPLDPTHAGELLAEDGWTLKEDGTPYDASEGGVRCKEIDGSIVPLKLKLIYPTENGMGPLLSELFIPYLEEAGMSLETEAVEMQDLLKLYYGQEERTCDMILLGTDFGDVFDPTGEYDDNGTNRRSGITDPVLKELAQEMRSTEPGNATEFCRRWLAYQARLMQTAAVIPLYSDAYLDFYIPELQDYEPGTTGSWAYAVTKAYLGDYVPQETEEIEEEDEFFE